MKVKYFDLENKRVFITGGGSGIGSIAHLFDVPVAWSNSIPLYSPGLKKSDLVILKLIWDTYAKRYLTFTEMTELGLFYPDIRGDTSLFFSDKSLRLDENSPDDILDLCIEMFQKISGESRSNDEIELQIEFDRRFMKGFANGQKLGCMSGKFLKKYAYLLD